MEEVNIPEKEENSLEEFALPGIISARFKRAEDARYSDEQRWLKAYRNYRGIYSSDMAFSSKEKSRIFVKITKTKVLASFGQLIEVLFGTGKFPIGVEPTPIPEGIAEFAHLKPDELKKQQPEDNERVDSLYGFPGDGNDLPPGATTNEFLGGLAKKFAEAGFEEGPAPDLKSMPQIEPAAMAASNMEKMIHDQLEESNAITILRHVMFEMALLGTGVIKGPFNFEKISHKWDDVDGEKMYNPSFTVVPKIEAVSCWDFYPDPDAVNLEDAEYVIQRHIMNKSQLRNLMNRPFFRESAINDCLKMGANYEPKSFESSLNDREDDRTIDKNRYEVFEYWGIMDKQLAELAGLELDDTATELDEVQINCWVCNGKIIRLVMNPFTPERLPYQVCPYEINPYQFFGIGIPENMEDAQQVMNGHARMAIDNLALAGNLVFDVDETMLVPGQDMSVFPGKIFRRQSGQTGQAIHGVKFPNTAPENMMMFDRFRQLADESTGIPSYSHGQTGVQSTTRTAAGMSMLMGASALNIKTVIKNIDDYLLKPLGEALFQWNMQFNDEAEIKGDLHIKARGTSSMMMKEVRSQRLMTFMQTAANPSLAPFVKWHTILREIAKTLDIDPDKVINDPEKAAIFAKIMGMVNGIRENQGNGGQSGMAESGGVPAGANPNDPTGSGGGNIGTGSVPQTGESGNSSPDGTT